MDIKFQNPGLKYSIDSIMMFQTEEFSDSWQNSLFELYPTLDRAQFLSVPKQDRKAYLYTVLKPVYDEKLPAITQKTKTFRTHWLQHRLQVEAAFSDAFTVDANALFNDLTANITFNPVSPRYLSECVFDVFEMNSEKGALGTSLHEMVHFFWFRIWQDVFQDDPAGYESPSLKWIFSEMAVDPIMRDPRLFSINPYCQSGCAYPCFYTMKIEGSLILDTLHSIYQSHGIRDFMKMGYDYCRQHEKGIRRQMD